jgi:hypothetical protein
MSPQAKPGRAGPGPGATVATAAVLVAAAAWLMADRIGSFPLVGRAGTGVFRLVMTADLPVRNFRLGADDFAYLVEARARGNLLAHLGTSRQGEVVPVFRTLTHVLVVLAGDLAHVRATFAHASFAALASMMMAGGRLVGREAGSRALGMAATAGLGITTVMEPATTSFSASRTLWASLFLLGMLLALQGWRFRGGVWRLVVAALAALASAMTCSAGFAAGPAGCAYLWAAGCPASRRAALVPLAVSVAAGLVALLAAGGLSSELSLVTALAHWVRAVPEGLFFANLGLDVTTTLEQAAVFALVLAAALAWSHRRVRPRPLEAAGAGLVLAGILLTPPSRVGSLTVPHIGAVLFLAGGWLAWRGEAEAASTPFVLAMVGAFVVWLLVLHLPRAQRLLEASVYPLSPAEAKRSRSRTSGGSGRSTWHPTWRSGKIDSWPGSTGPSVSRLGSASAATRFGRRLAGSCLPYGPNGSGHMMRSISWPSPSMARKPTPCASGMRCARPSSPRPNAVPTGLLPTSPGPRAVVTSDEP